MPITEELLKRCMSNDTRAQNELYRACYSFIKRICYRYYNNEDEVLTSLNESFFKIVTNLKSYRHESPFEVWMRRITINTIIDSYRRAKKMKDVLHYTDLSTPDFAEPITDENETELKMEAEDILKLIHLLPPMCKKIFNLYVIDGYNHREIGEMLEISEGTSKSQLFEARKKLQQMVKNYHTPKITSNELAK